jgi:universal stress protein E
LSRHQDLLDSLSASARVQGIAVSTQVTHGPSLHESILRYLSHSNATLLVKDTHHHSLVRRTILPNTDWYLAHTCSIPLLLTKPHEWAKTPVIMAAVEPTPGDDDLTALDRKILKCATSLATRVGGDFHVIHAYIPVALAAAGTEQGRGVIPELAATIECETSFRLGQIESLARAYGVPTARLHVEMGTPESRLLDLVNQYRTDVIVIGASSHGRWHRMIVGSTASAVLESLPCDILVVRPDGSPNTPMPLVNGASEYVSYRTDPIHSIVNNALEAAGLNPGIPGV